MRDGLEVVRTKKHEPAITRDGERIALIVVANYYMYLAHRRRLMRLRHILTDGTPLLPEPLASLTLSGIRRASVT
jgi:hypothetical protein